MGIVGPAVYLCWGLCQETTWFSFPPPLGQPVTTATLVTKDGQFFMNIINQNKTKNRNNELGHGEAIAWDRRTYCSFSTKNGQNITDVPNGIHNPTPHPEGPVAFSTGRSPITCAQKALAIKGVAASLLCGRGLLVCVSPT